MNRKERRKSVLKQTDESEELVPVFCGRRCLAKVRPERLPHLLRAPNVKPVYRHRDRKIVELQVHDIGNDSEQPSRGGNASTESHDHETPTNPPRCWTLRWRKAS